MILFRFLPLHGIILTRIISQTVMWSTLLNYVTQALNTVMLMASLLL